MGLISMININDDRKEHNTTRVAEKDSSKKDYGYFVYEALEYGKNNKNFNGVGMQIELMKSFVR